MIPRVPAGKLTLAGPADDRRGAAAAFSKLTGPGTSSPSICTNGHVAKSGPNYGNLLQYYGIHKTTAAAQKKFLKVTRAIQPNGAIKLVITGAV